MNKDKPVIIPLAEQTPHPAEIADDLDATHSATPIDVRQGSGLWGWIMGLFLTCVISYASISIWGFATQLITQNMWLGWGFTALVIATGLAVLIAISKDLLALRRLKNVSTLRQAAADAITYSNSDQARNAAGQIAFLYRNRPELRDAIQAQKTAQSELVDGFAIVEDTERLIIAPLDKQATAEIERAARQVATVTALIPLAMADIIAAFVINLRMIRNIAEIYAGRGGVFSSWRLLQSVMSHLITTGAVAIGDDWLGQVFGSSLLAKLSRRFGEGMVNGALTARVGRAAIEVCRPLEFRTEDRPKVTQILKRALQGVFDKTAD